MDTHNNSRPMFEGNWTCAGCGCAITKLPFQPDESRANTLKCRDCFKKERGAGGAGQRSERKMFEGSWTCADCGKEITKMPFQPRDGSTVKCVDCFRASRG